MATREKKWNVKKYLDEEEMKVYTKIDKLSLATEIKKTEETKKTLNRILQIQASVVNEDGQQVTGSLEELVMYQGLMDAIKHPKGLEQALTLAKIRNEVRDQHDVNVNDTGKSLFGDIAIKDTEETIDFTKPNDTNNNEVKSS